MTTPETPATAWRIGRHTKVLYGGPYAEVKAEAERLVRLPASKGGERNIEVHIAGHSTFVFWAYRDKANRVHTKEIR